MGIKRVSVCSGSKIVIFLLFLTSCAYHTELPCPFGLTMKQLDKKCDYIQHGSTKKWVLKKEKK